MPDSLRRVPQETVNALIGARARHRRRVLLLGCALACAGYASLAIPPEAAMEVALFRVVLGFGLLFSGFAVAIYPLLDRLFEP